MERCAASALVTGAFEVTVGGRLAPRKVYLGYPQAQEDDASGLCAGTQIACSAPSDMRISIGALTVRRLWRFD